MITILAWVFINFIIIYAIIEEIKDYPIQKQFKQDMKRLNEKVIKSILEERKQQKEREEYEIWYKNERQKLEKTCRRLGIEF